MPRPHRHSRTASSHSRRAPLWRRAARTEYLEARARPRPRALLQVQAERYPEKARSVTRTAIRLPSTRPRIGCPSKIEKQISSSACRMSGRLRPASSLLPSARERVLHLVFEELKRPAPRIFFLRRDSTTMCGSVIQMRSILFGIGHARLLVACERLTDVRPEAGLFVRTASFEQERQLCQVEDEDGVHEELAQGFDGTPCDSRRRLGRSQSTGRSVRSWVPALVVLRNPARTLSSS